jgi:hypothetical protein
VNRFRGVDVTRCVKRIVLFLVALFSSTTASASSSAVSCDAGTDHVTYDGSSAAYWAAGKRVGASRCAGTRMAIFSMTCTEDPAFQFYFASIPGPAILGGKSARLDVGGKSELLSCK